MKRYYSSPKQVAPKVSKNSLVYIEIKVPDAIVFQ